MLTLLNVLVDMGGEYGMGLAPLRCAVSGSGDLSLCVRLM
jgi:hypothetical protein